MREMKNAAVRHVNEALSRSGFRVSQLSISHEGSTRKKNSSRLYDHERNRVLAR
jgi:hypothetical protein